MENSKAQDIFTSGLVIRPEANDNAIALGKYIVECIGADGKLKWVEETPNLVVNSGLKYMAGTSLDGVTTRITSWFVGLKAAGTPAAGDTLNSHPSWAELAAGTVYTGNRPAATFAVATTPSGSGNPSVVTNSASKATFNIITSTTVVGAFLCNAASGSTSSDTLFSAGDFSSSRSVVNGDTLQVTYTFSLSA